MCSRLCLECSCQCAGNTQAREHVKSHLGNTISKIQTVGISKGHIHSPDPK